MARFEFRNNDLTLDIAGNVFRVPATAEKMQQLIQWGRDVVKKADDLSGNEEAKAVNEAIAFMHEGLDGFLGAGASDRIFAGREPNLIDCIDVMNYISEEFNQFKNKILSRLNRPIKENEYSG